MLAGLRKQTVWLLECVAVLAVAAYLGQKLLEQMSDPTEQEQEQPELSEAQMSSQRKRRESWKRGEQPDGERKETVDEDDLTEEEEEIVEEAGGGPTNGRQAAVGSAGRGGDSKSGASEVPGGPRPRQPAGSPPERPAPRSVVWSWRAAPTMATGATARTAGGSGESSDHLRRGCGSGGRSATPGADEGWQTSPTTSSCGKMTSSRDELFFNMYETYRMLSSPAPSPQK